MNTGKLFVLYGVNNLGKSTQAHMLVDALNAQGKKTIYIKYPIYNLVPSGPLLNEYLRGGNPYNFSPREAQFLYILNRTQYQETLNNILSSGTHVVAEDYIGTGIAWGVAAGVDIEILELMNSHLRPEDVVCLFTGMRFTTGIESDHLHENNDSLTKTVASTLEMLAKKHHWHIINANQDKQKVHKDVLDIVQTILDI